MEFIKLNYRKIFFIFCLCMTFGSCLALIAYNHMNKSELTEFMTTMFTFTYGASFTIFVCFFTAGMYDFYRAQRLLNYVLSLDIFDGGSFRKGYLDKKALLFYTQKCLIGTLLKYPVVIWIYQSNGARRSFVQIAVNFYYLKGDKTNTWSLYIPVDHKEHPESEVKFATKNTVLMLNNKGYTSGDLHKGLEIDGAIFE